MKKLILTLTFTILICSVLCSYYSTSYAITNGEEEVIVLEKDDTGDDVILLQLRLRDLGYYNYKITNVFGYFTQSALKDFQDENDLKESGILDQETYDVLYSNEAARKPVHTVVKSVYTGSSTSTSSSGTLIIAAANTSSKAPSWNGSYGALRDWFSYVDTKFERGDVITVYAVDSGITFQVKRYGGTNHADVEPLTADDAAKLKEAHGGAYGWERMAVIVQIDGELIAASMNGQPHESCTITDNNFDGHCCMHFQNSKTHGTNSVCQYHQSMVQRAAGN